MDYCHLLLVQTRAPQGTVLAPFLFVLYTADCRSTDESCPIVKFADDTELVGKISNNEDALYHKQIENFVNWCDKTLLVFECFQNERNVHWFQEESKMPQTSLH